MTDPPRGVYFTALESRLSTTWSSRRGSAWKPESSGQPGRDLEPGGLRRRGLGVDRLAHQRSEVDRLRLDPVDPGVEPRQVEQVRDQDGGLAQAAGDHLEVAALLLLELALGEHQVEVAARDGQRRTQLVPGHREELVAHPLGLLEAADALPLQLEDALGQLVALGDVGGDAVVVPHTVGGAGRAAHPQPAELTVVADQAELALGRLPGQHARTERGVEVLVVRVDHLAHRPGDVHRLVDLAAEEPDRVGAGVDQVDLVVAHPDRPHQVVEAGDRL